MSFRFPIGARSYFSQIENAPQGRARFDTMFDQFYLCLIVGLDRLKLAIEDDVEADRFIERYPSQFQPQSYIIAGLLVNAELERKAIAREDRNSIEGEMLSLLDHQSPTHLSEAALGLLNRYAAEGFKTIRERIPQPQSLEEFLVAYHDIWQDPSQ